MNQPGFFDLSDRYEQLSRDGDPLVKLNEIMDWKIFLPLISRAFDKRRKSATGRKPYNRLLMFKIMVLQSLYNLSDHQTEFQIRDRLSFMRFLNLNLEDKIPDEKTLWSFREVLVQGKVIEKLFDRFERFLEKNGWGAQAGTIIDASIVEVPKQRNNREDNKTIKAGKIPENFTKDENKLRQKDVDARWAIKRGKTYYGYKNHTNVDAKNKLIRAFEVTSAPTSDINCFELLLRDNQKDKKIWADAAYHSEDIEELLKDLGYESRIIRSYGSHHPRGSYWDRENSRRAKIRKRIEHVYGFMQNSMKGKFIRTVGMARAKTKIGMMNLVYNFCRFEQLCRIGAS